MAGAGGGLGFNKADENKLGTWHGYSVPVVNLPSSFPLYSGLNPEGFEASISEVIADSL